MPRSNGASDTLASMPIDSRAGFFGSGWRKSLTSRAAKEPRVASAWFSKCSRMNERMPAKSTVFTVNGNTNSSLSPFGRGIFHLRATPGLALLLARIAGKIVESITTAITMRIVHSEVSEEKFISGGTIQPREPMKCRSFATSCESR